MAAGAAYPVRFDVDYPERLSRWLIFVKWLLPAALRRGHHWARLARLTDCLVGG